MNRAGLIADQNRAILQALTDNGWALLSAETAIASKPFPCLDYIKKAVVYLSRGDGYNRTIQPVYWSEGYNVAESCCALIPVDATPEQARELTAAALQRAEKAINNSYGVRLAIVRE